MTDKVMGGQSHTPGPWEVEESPYLHVRAKDGSQGGWGECVFASDYATEANARLISAAPELLEALEDLMEAIGTQDPEWAWEERKNARAAIAKATGESAA